MTDNRSRSAIRFLSHGGRRGAAPFRLTILCAGVLLATVRTATSEDAEPLQTFALEERFGVDHPDQIVDFDLDKTIDPDDCRLIGPDGAEVPFQLLRGGTKLALRTDLPAFSSRRWRLLSGPPTISPDGIRVTSYRDGNRDLLQITNGLTGVRVPLPVERPAPGDRPLADLLHYGPDVPRLILPAPVQGVLYRDGNWTATGPNAVVFLADRLLKMEVRFLEKGPLVTVVEVSYRVEHPEYQYGERRLAAAGEGSYRSTITIQAGQPSLLFEEDTDLEMTWSINLYEGLRPTTGHYRGHHASKKEFGQEPDGRTYRPSPDRPPLDAEVDLFDKNGVGMPEFPSPGRKRWLPAWDPWAFDTGWYWQLFDAKAPASANVAGIFAGRASLARGTGASGVYVLSLAPSEKPKNPVAGLIVASYRRSASNAVFPHSHFQWGLFAGTKGKDLRAPAEVQPINLQMNLHGGFNLNKIHRYVSDFPDPSGGYDGLYMDRREVEAFKQKLTGPHGQEFHDYLSNAEPGSRPLIDMWADRSGEKRRAAVDEVQKTATDLLTSLVNREGIYTFRYLYWMGGLEMVRLGIWIDQILADPNTSDEERRAVKTAAALFAQILWDDDFSPLDNAGDSINLGNANMPVMQIGFRDFYALLLARHPMWAQRAERVRKQTLEMVRKLVNEHGAEIGCPHYIGASFAPTLDTLMQLKQVGGDDPFQAEPRLAQFAEFYLNLQTPPEPQVGGKRAFISLGDSSTEPSELFGQLGTAFRDADSRLSARLMGAWHANGKPHSNFWGTTLLMIDEDLPTADPKLGDATFPGYYSVLRHGWGTPRETAVWQVNGDHYSDHRHNDHGSVVIYALGKPLSLHWESMYQPEASAAYLQSRVLYESEIGHAWDMDCPPVSGRPAWPRSQQRVFASFAEGAYVQAKFETGDKSTWMRSVLSLHADEDHPILVLHDTFSGEGAHLPKVLTFNLMATGAVETPAGEINPTLRFHPASEHPTDPSTQLPSAGQPFNLPPGVNRFGFHGQYDVDWDVYTVSAEPQQALIGNWGVTPWGPHITVKEERQHILRVRGSGALTTLILPWRRGDKPAGLTVRTEGGAVIVKTADATARIEPTGYTYTGKDKIISRKFEH